MRARWGRSENRRKAKYYTLTERGRGALEEEQAVWSAFSTAIERALGADT